MSDHARRLVADSDNEALLSAGSLWEITIKVSLGKLTLAGGEAYRVHQGAERIRANALYHMRTGWIPLGAGRHETNPSHAGARAGETE